MLSITNHQQVNFKRNENKVSDSDIQKYEKVQDELNEDTFVSENIEQTNPRHRNPVSKFVRNMILGTALVGGLGAAAPKAEAQVPVGKVITEQKAVDPKDPSKGTATYYYTQEAVMDSIISNSCNGKKTQKFDRKLLNTYPVIKYSYKNIQPNNSYIYSYTTRPMDKVEDGYCIDTYKHNDIELRTLSGKKMLDYEDETSGASTRDRTVREPEYLYTPAPLEDPFFNNPAMQDNVVKKGNQIIKKGNFISHSTNKPYTVTAYYTERPVLDSVIVKKPNGETTTRLDRDCDTKAVHHIGYSDSDGKKANWWVSCDEDGFINTENKDTDGTFLQETYVPVKPGKK